MGREGNNLTSFVGNNPPSSHFIRPNISTKTEHHHNTTTTVLLTGPILYKEEYNTNQNHTNIVIFSNRTINQQKQIPHHNSINHHHPNIHHTPTNPHSPYQSLPIIITFILILPVSIQDRFDYSR